MVLATSTSQSNQTPFFKVVEQTIAHRFSVELNTPLKKIVVTVVFISFYVLLPFALYFGIGTLIAGPIAFRSVFLASQIGMTIGAGSLLVSIALLVANVHFALRVNSQNIFYSLNLSSSLNLAYRSNIPLVENKKKEVNRSIKEQFSSYMLNKKWSESIIFYFIDVRGLDDKNERRAVVLNQALLLKKFEIVKAVAKTMEDIDASIIGYPLQNPVKKINLLNYAFVKDDLALMDFLLDNGADADQHSQLKNDSMTLLATACFYIAQGQNDVEHPFEKIDLLLRHGASPNCTEAISSKILLDVYTEKKEHVSLATYLFKHGAIPSKQACINVMHHSPNLFLQFLAKYPDLTKENGKEFCRSAKYSPHRFKIYLVLLEAGFSPEKTEVDFLDLEIGEGNLEHIQNLVEVRGVKITRSHIENAKSRCDLGLFRMNSEKVEGESISYAQQIFEYLQIEFTKQQFKPIRSGKIEKKGDYS